MLAVRLTHLILLFLHSTVSTYNHHNGAVSTDVYRISSRCVGGLGGASEG
jgi:hypothetical protein